MSPACEPLASARMEFWHTDDDGEYDNTGYRFRGHLFTDDLGRFRLETIVPGLYTGRTRHIHVKVQPDGGRHPHDPAVLSRRARQRRRRHLRRAPPHDHGRGRRRQPAGRVHLRGRIRLSASLPRARRCDRRYAAPIDTSELARQAVDALEVVSGRHPGYRAAHAKGTLCAASFTPTAEAAELSRAAHFRGPPVRAHVRFSNGSGDPSAPDFEPREGRGIATKYYLPDGSTTDAVGLTLPAFFVNTVAGFLDFVRARTPDPVTGEPDPAAIGEFLGAHPEALPAAEAVLTAAPPESYLRCAYNSLHAYRFIADSGDWCFVRYRWEPDLGAADLAPEDAQARGADYLQLDLAERLERGPVGFTVLARVAEPGDPVDDPAVPWPDDRRAVWLGRLEIAGIARDRDHDGDILVFDPTRVTDGIELTDDEILRFRSHAYAESVLRRTGVARAAT